MYSERTFIPLRYSGNLIRTICLDHTLWWVLVDVCRVVGLGNASRAADRLYDHEKMTLTMGNSHFQQRGGAQKLILINEYGIYHLLLTSTKPEAKLFQAWVTAEVLPSVRKNGGYIMGQDHMDAEELAYAAGNVAHNILEERDREIQNLRLENAEQAALLSEWAPKVRYCDAVLCSQDAIPIRAIAINYGFSAQELNSYLHERGVQYKCAGTWLLYHPYAGKGYTQTRPILTGSPYSKLHTYWMPRGQAFLYEFLRQDGILPQNEQMHVSGDIEDCCRCKLCPRSDRR